MLGGGIGYAATDDPVPAFLGGLGMAIGFLAYAMSQDELVRRSEELKAEIKTITDATRPAVCAKAKKFQQDLKDLDPFFVDLKPDMVGLYEHADLKALVKAACVKPEEKKEDEDEDEEEEMSTLAELHAKATEFQSSLMSDIKSLDADAKPSEKRDIFVAGYDKMEKTVCKPFDTNKTAYDKDSNKFKMIVEGCEENDIAVSQMKKFADFDANAETLLGLHEDLGKEDDEAMEYAKTIKDKLKIDGGQVCSLGADVADQEGAFIDYKRVYELLSDPAIDACKKDA
jgi:hypothetical protein